MGSGAAGEICLIPVTALVHIPRYICEKEKFRGDGSVSESNTISKANKGANQLHIKSKTEKNPQTIKQAAEIRPKCAYSRRSKRAFFSGADCFCSFNHVSDLKESPFSLPEGIKDPSKGEFELFVLA